MSFDTYAYFWVAGFDGSPDAITRDLGLQPTEVWAKGDSWYPGRPRPDSVWHLHSTLPRTEMFMEEHLEALLTLIEPKAEAIGSLRSRYAVGISCVGYYRNEHPGFHLSAALIARLHVLSLDVDFDLYCCGELEPPSGRDD